MIIDATISIPPGENDEGVKRALEGVKVGTGNLRCYFLRDTWFFAILDSSNRGPPVKCIVVILEDGKKNRREIVAFTSLHVRPSLVLPFDWRGAESTRSVNISGSIKVPIQGFRNGILRYLRLAFFRKDMLSSALRCETTFRTELSCRRFLYPLAVIGFNDIVQCK